MAWAAAPPYTVGLHCPEALRPLRPLTSGSWGGSEGGSSSSGGATGRRCRLLSAKGFLLPGVLGASCGVPRWLAGKRLRLRIQEHSSRRSRVARRFSPLIGLITEIEASQVVVAAAAAAALIGNQPRTAPGPTEDLLAQEERLTASVNEARTALELAAPKDVSEARQDLREKLDKLAQVEAQISDANMDVQSYPVPEYLQADFQRSNIMIAVTGASGVGKSSLINAVRRLRPSDAGAAKVGITETTAKPQVFPFPKTTELQSGEVLENAAGKGLFRRTLNRLKAKLFRPKQNESSHDDEEVEEAIQEEIQIGDRVLVRGHGDAKVVKSTAPGSWTIELQSGEVLENVAGQDLIGVLAQCVMWDLPGVGTAKFPQATYLRTFGIRYFDVVVLMTATRFTEAELMLVEELRYWRIPYFLVRNKTDEDVNSEIEKKEEELEDDLSTQAKQLVEHETIQTIKDYFHNKFGLDNVYCVSTKRRLLHRYDFRNLEIAINEAVSFQRSTEETNCPRCFMAYTDSSAFPLAAKTRALCGHACCEACRRSMTSCYKCGASLVLDNLSR